MSALGRSPAAAATNWMGLVSPAMLVLAALCGSLAMVLATGAALNVWRGQPVWTGRLWGSYLLAIPMLCLLPGAALHSARQQVEVCQRRQAPHGGKLASIGAWHRLMVIVLVVMWLPMLLTAAAQELGRRPWHTDLRGYSLALQALHITGLALLATAGWRGLLPPVWILAAPLLLLEWALRLAGWWPGSARAAGPWPEAGLALTLPLAWWVCARHLGQPLAPLAAPAAPKNTPLRLWQGLRRDIQKAWRPLDGQRSPLGLLLVMAVLVPLGDLGPGQLAITWGGAVTPWFVPRLAWLTLLMALLLRGPDLHWRQLLAPQGLARRQLGWHILQHSLCGMVLLWVLSTLLTTLVFLPVLTPPLRLDLLRIIPLQAAAQLPELMLATTLAAALAAAGHRSRGARRWERAALVAGFALPIMLAGVGQYFDWPTLNNGLRAPLWHRDAGHALSVLALSAGVAWAAARLWSRADLSTLLAERATSPDRRH
ncbi:hypothetical protein [Aquabacterium sp. OR-4]|uniref:hypothetical protein n=1 Tax=Aquabacterium sp. OR-4 TaxID=2978127 RepID=UPI0021B269BB|nr:hypothetical protein [Aquabacterium sp. OR-4]MDT7834541.1 hypothetical protein [Aquabacterium sp. OR-4]